MKRKKERQNKDKENLISHHYITLLLLYHTTYQIVDIYIHHEWCLVSHFFLKVKCFKFFKKS